MRRDSVEARGGAFSTEEEEVFKQTIRENFERESHRYFAAARLWDDGIIPAQETRRGLPTCDRGDGLSHRSTHAGHFGEIIVRHAAPRTPL